MVCILYNYIWHRCEHDDGGMSGDNFLEDINNHEKLLKKNSKCRMLYEDYGCINIF